MIDLRGVFRRHPFAAFACLTLTYGYLAFLVVPLFLGITPHSIGGHAIREFGYMPLPLGLSYVGSNPELLLFFAYGASPSLAGLTVAFAGWGLSGLLEIARRFRPWPSSADGAVAPYLVIVTGFLIACGMMIGIHYALGGIAAESPFIGVTILSFLTALVFGLSMNPGGVLEEAAGYRGFALPTLLQSGVTPLKASILIGVLWFIWHHAVPFSPLLVDTHMISTDSDFWSKRLPVFSGYMLFINLSTSIVMTHFHLRTGRSTLPAVMIHSGINSLPFGLHLQLAGPAFASQASLLVSVVLTVLMCFAAIIVILRYGSGLAKPRSMPAADHFASRPGDLLPGEYGATKGDTRRSQR